jgi:hypothetical protein
MPTPAGPGLHPPAALLPALGFVAPVGRRAGEAQHLAARRSDFDGCVAVRVGV